MLAQERGCDVPTSQPLLEAESENFQMVPCRKICAQTFATRKKQKAAALPRSPALFQHTRNTMGPKIEEIEDELPPMEDVDEASTAESGDAKVRATRSSADRTTSAEQDLAPRSR